jgi:hypothetical protein
MSRNETMPLQRDMFSEKLVDNRSRHHKRKDKARSQPQQMGMFSLKDTVELGVSARPWLKELPAPNWSWKAKTSAPTKKKNLIFCAKHSH